MTKRLYYVVEKELQYSRDDGFDVYEETTGWKTVILYDENYDENEGLVMVHEKELDNRDSAKDYLEKWVKEEYPDLEFKLVQL